jgi:hypothetical protein
MQAVTGAGTPTVVAGERFVSLLKGIEVRDIESRAAT